MLPGIFTRQCCGSFLLTIALGLLLTFGIASAQVDPDPDMIGIYFDEDATVYCITALSPVTAYLCITNSTALAGIAGWEATIEMTEGTVILDSMIRGDGQNVGVPPEFIVGLVDCLPWSPSIVVLEFTVGVFSPDRIELAVGPISGYEIPPPCPLPLFTACDGGGEIMTLGYAGGADPLTCEPYVCAIINGDCNVVPEEIPTWGQVKSMYR